MNAGSSFFSLIPGRPLLVTRPGAPNSLRLAVDLSHLRPGGESGGVKPFVLEYLRELAALEGTELTLVLLTCSASHDEVRALARPHDEMVCIRHNTPEDAPKPGNWRNGELFVPAPPAHLLLLLRIDVFYVPLISAEFACPGIPTLSTVVDVLHRDYPATLPHHANVQRERLFQELVRVSETFQCISHYTAGQMTAHYGVPPERTFCSHIIIHQRLGAEGAGAKGDYFLYPANAWPHKNHDTLLVAFRQYCRLHGAGAWKLVLTGHDNVAMRQILAHAGHLGLAKQVVFHGHLPEEDFSRLWREAGALVFPSLHEGFGIPLVEAMHFGVPILSSRAGSLPEVAGDAAVYADAHDPSAWAIAMTELAQSPERRAQLVAHGRRRLAEFSLPAEIAEFRDSIRGLPGRPVRQWHKGVHPDGWIEGLAMLGLPVTQGPMQIELTVAPCPAPRRVRLYRGLAPLGGFEVPAGGALCHTVTTEAGHGPLVVEVPDACSLSATDHRRHGIILARVTARDAAGQEYNLLEDAP